MPINFGKICKDFYFVANMCLATEVVIALPIGVNVINGSVKINNNINETVINQTTDKAIVNWNSFNVNPNETVRFNQPSNNSTILNRINSANGTSLINGNIIANGNIFLINSAGIIFGKSARIDVSGLLASTANITDFNFLKNNYEFIQDPNFLDSKIINYGSISIRDYGIAALFAPSVENHGIIVANKGVVNLASGTHATIDFGGTGVINFAIDNKSKKIINKGTIKADGGKILINSQTVSDVLDNVINMEGVLEANTVEEKNGKIILSAKNGIANVSANITAAKGDVEILAKEIIVEEKAVINVSAIDGAGTIKIGGGKNGKGTDFTAVSTELRSGSKILADAKEVGNGGIITTWGDKILYVGSTLRARGGRREGDGGFIETSSDKVKFLDGFTARAYAINGKAGMWLIDPSDDFDDNAATNANNSLNGTGFGGTDVTWSVTSSGNSIKFVNNVAVNWSTFNKLTFKSDDGFIFSGANPAIQITGQGTLELDGNRNSTGITQETDFGGAQHIDAGVSGKVAITYLPKDMLTDNISTGITGATIANGNLTVEIPIKTEEHLKKLSAAYNASQFTNGLTYKIMNDITLSNATGQTGPSNDFTDVNVEPIGDKNNAFYGTIDGNNKKIIGLTQKYYDNSGNNTYSDGLGLIGRAAGGAVIIKDLELQDVQISLDNTNATAGGFIGKYDESNTPSHGNHYVKLSNIKTTGNSFVRGGMTGSAGGFIGNITITDPMSQTSENILTIENSRNEAKINENTLSTSNGPGDAGGFVGYVGASGIDNTTPRIISISGSTNKGDYGDSAGGNYNSGMIAKIAIDGGTSAVSQEAILIDNSSNEGNAKTTSSGYVAGFIGSATIKIQTPKEIIKINNSNNKGNIINGTSAGGSNSLGGFIGELKLDNSNSTAGNAVSILNSYNTGTIKGSDKDVAGFIGILSGDPVQAAKNMLNIDNSYNTGAITGTTEVGGLLGKVDVKNMNPTQNVINISNSHNTGNITGNDSGASGEVGGLIGYSINSSTPNQHVVKIFKSYNTGNISSTNNGGVGGLLGTSNGTGSANNNFINITESYNTGSISAGSRGAGGIIGSSSFLSATSNTHMIYIYDSYNQGNITASTDEAGGIIGSYNTNSSIGTTPKSFDIKNVYSTGSITSGGSNKGGIIGKHDNQGGNLTASSLTNAYWLDTSATNAIGSNTGVAVNITGGGAKTADEMKNRETFIGFGLPSSETTSKWQINNCTAYPTLGTGGVSGAASCGGGSGSSGGSSNTTTTNNTQNQDPSKQSDTKVLNKEQTGGGTTPSPEVIQKVNNILKKVKDILVKKPEEEFKKEENNPKAKSSGSTFNNMQPQKFSSYNNYFAKDMSNQVFEAKVKEIEKVVQAEKLFVIGTPAAVTAFAHAVFLRRRDFFFKTKGDVTGVTATRDATSALAAEYEQIKKNYDNQRYEI